jgi:leader peptidase (prepilin peptidase)/N-methyltransferase
MPPAAAIPLLTIAGLAIGSFLNVCIHRLPRGESLAWPGSHCPRCRQPIAWFHNVPVLGYLALGGRCARCRERISPVYPLVEAGTAALFVLTYLELGWTPLLAVRLAFAAAMVVLFFVDLEHQILPNVITVPGIVLGLLASLVLEPGWRSAAAGAAVGGGILWLIAEVYLRARGIEGMGMGDVKMLAMIGAFLGLPLVILTLVGASLGGALAGLAVVATRRGGLQYALPFGTFLAVAAVAAGLWGTPLVEWYLSALQY